MFRKRLRRKIRRIRNNFHVRIPLFSRTAWRAAWRMAQLTQIVQVLRSPSGCPWDQKQTLRSILPDLREETLEAIHAGQGFLQGDDPHDFCEELGDVMFLITFLSQFCEEEGTFTIADALQEITQKLIRRHPHVFGDVDAKDTDEIKLNWARIKAQEKQRRSPQTPLPSIFDGIPETLPALHFAQQVSKKAVQVGFDWPDTSSVWKKVQEETQELQQAIENEGTQEQEAELGDLLFTLVNLARHLQLDGENALLATCLRFQSRFRYVEAQLANQKRAPHDATQQELEELWQQAKEKEKQKREQTNV